jgi:hypothetical protein
MRAGAISVIAPAQVSMLRIRRRLLNTGRHEGGRS